jgi:hypothetical protein
MPDPDTPPGNRRLRTLFRLTEWTHGVPAGTIEREGLQGLNRAVRRRSLRTLPIALSLLAVVLVIIWLLS